MELAVQVHIEHLPEGFYLATSDELPGLVAQGRTIAEALEIARDVAKKLIEARREREGMPSFELPPTVRIIRLSWVHDWAALRVFDIARWSGGCGSSVSNSTVNAATNRYTTVAESPR